MRVIRWNPKAAVVTILITAAVFFLVALKLLEKDLKSSDDEVYNLEVGPAVEETKDRVHKLAVIVPFRNRFEELMEFVPSLHDFLSHQQVVHRIYIINQADKLRFNRASLINIGYQYSNDECDYLAMHDVDLLPLNPALNYKYPDGHVFHVAAPNLHPLYHYPKFVGGILILTHADFYMVNGLSNRYWGWGREDDEFYVRMKEADLQIKRPSLQEVNTGNKTFRHIHDKVKRPRDYKRIGNQKLEGNKRDRRTGVRDVSYKITEVYNITVQGAQATVVNVQLECDTEDTPWCEDT